MNEHYRLASPTCWLYCNRGEACGYVVSAGTAQWRAFMLKTSQYFMNAKPNA
jgi:hypothetical protein